MSQAHVIRAPSSHERFFRPLALNWPQALQPQALDPKPKTLRVRHPRPKAHTAPKPEAEPQKHRPRFGFRVQGSGFRGLGFRV